MSEYRQAVVIKSTDGKNPVEKTIHELEKQADKGRVEQLRKRFTNLKNKPIKVG